MAKYWHPAGGGDMFPATDHVALSLNCQGGIKLLFLLHLWGEADFLESKLINEETPKGTKLQFQSAGLLIKCKDLILYFAVFQIDHPLAENIEREAFHLCSRLISAPYRRAVRALVFSLKHKPETRAGVKDGTLTVPAFVQSHKKWGVVLDPQGERPVPAAPWNWEPFLQGGECSRADWVTPWHHSINRAAGGKNWWWNGCCKPDLVEIHVGLVARKVSSALLCIFHPCWLTRFSLLPAQFSSSLMWILRCNQLNNPFKGAALCCAGNTGNCG